jgi:hypothetical protein
VSNTDAITMSNADEIVSSRNSTTATSSKRATTSIYTTNRCGDYAKQALHMYICIGSIHCTLLRVDVYCKSCSAVVVHSNLAQNNKQNTSASKSASTYLSRVTPSSASRFNSHPALFKL